MALNKEIIAELKTKLENEKTRLEDELGRFAEPIDSKGNYETKYSNIGDDEDENATEVEDYTDNLALENNLESQLRDTISALDRIESGTYGICENCKDEINIERLRAYPAAKTCIKCG